MNVLLVKMSSLGDIVHTLPAVDDAVQRGFRFDWVVEENFQELPVRAAGVDRVLAVAFRRWRAAPRASIKELRAFRECLRQRRYDLVLDAQGLLKSALVSSWSRADERVGYDAASAREPAASLGYGRRLRVPRRAHAVDRTRQLFADALGYEAPATDPVFGIDACRNDDVVHATESVVLVHGTTWPTKHWPEAFWVELAQCMTRRGLTPVLPWVEGERARAERIAAAVPGARVCPRLDLGGVLRLLGSARGIVGVDSGLTHLGAALGLPTVMVFGPTDPALTGCRGPLVRNLSASLACSPCHSKRCRLRLASQPHREWANGMQLSPPCLAAVAPAAAWSALADLMGRRHPGVVG